MEQYVGLFTVNRNIGCTTRVYGIGGRRDILVLLVLLSRLSRLRLDRSILSQIGVWDGKLRKVSTSQEIRLPATTTSDLWIIYCFHEICVHIFNLNFSASRRVRDDFLRPSNPGGLPLFVVLHITARRAFGLELLVDLGISMLLIRIQTFHKLLDIWDGVPRRVVTPRGGLCVRHFGGAS